MEIFASLFIHLLVPAGGIYYYMKLVRTIKNEKIPHPPIVELFILFATFGGVLLVLLTAFFWRWSGLASLGGLYLLFLAPLLLLVLAITNFRYRKLSVYHRWVVSSSLTYFILASLLWLVIIFGLEDMSV